VHAAVARNPASMPPGPHARPSAPNILVVIADDHRADAIGALGHPVVLTPELDRLVRRGTVCTQARIAGGLMPAVCSPSRACLFTGRHPFQADAAPGIVRDPPYEVRLPSDARTFAEHFRAAGYETFFTGKWHNDEAALLRSFESGRNIFQGGMCEHTRVPVRDLAEIKHGAPTRVAQGFSTEIFCASAEEFIRGRDPTRPFLACVALTSPHDPRTPPQQFRTLYENRDIPLPANFQPTHAFDNGELAIRDELILPHPLDPWAVQQESANYYGMISHHDAQLGCILATLAEKGQMENTIVVYLSDHGLGLGSHGLLGKQNLYEPSVRVPFILAGPGVPAGLRHPGLVYAFDLYATLCDLARLPVPAGLDSVSLLPPWPSAQLPGRGFVCAAYGDCQRMITDGRWKLIVYHTGAETRRQLFDLAADPDECHDRAAEPAQSSRIAGLQSRLAAWQLGVGDRWMPVTLSS
jgi:arylsulfatase A-like enzyme